MRSLIVLVGAKHFFSTFLYSLKSKRLEVFLPRVLVHPGLRAINDLLQHALVDPLPGDPGAIRLQIFPDFGCAERRPGRERRVVLLTSKPVQVKI